MKAAWWWVDRWRKSTAYTRLTLEEQGAYRNLLDELWTRGGVLVNDDRYLANVCGDATRWPKLRDKVLSYFELRDDGWHNLTHDEVQAESQKRAERQKRYREKTRNVTHNVAPSPSPSPSPSKRQPTEDGQSAKPDDGFTPGIEEVFAYWHQATKRTKATKLDPRRRRMLRARLKEEDGPLDVRVAALKLAVDGAVHDRFYAGENERGKRYWELPNIFRNRDRVEELQAAGRRAVAQEALKVEVELPELAPTDEAALAYWENTKDHLKELVPAQNWNTWFRPTFGHHWEGEQNRVLVVAVPSRQHRDQLREVYHDRIKALVGETLIKLTVGRVP